MPKNLDMDCLRTFVTIVDVGSFAEAAHRVGRTASAVSLQIKRLEDQVAAKLFLALLRAQGARKEGERASGRARRRDDEIHVDLPGGNAANIGQAVNGTRATSFRPYGLACSDRFRLPGTLHRSIEERPWPGLARMVERGRACCARAGSMP